MIRCPLNGGHSCRPSFRGSLEPAVDKVRRRIKPGETPVLVATSGTAMAIGSLAASEEERPTPQIAWVLRYPAEPESGG